MKKYIDPDCAVCEGEGIIVNSQGDEDECQCVKVNRELAALADEHE